MTCKPFGLHSGSQSVLFNVRIINNDHDCCDWLMADHSLHADVYRNLPGCKWDQSFEPCSHCTNRKYTPWQRGSETTLCDFQQPDDSRVSIVHCMFDGWPCPSQHQTYRTLSGCSHTRRWCCQQIKVAGYKHGDYPPHMRVCVCVCKYEETYFQCIDTYGFNVYIK